MGKRNSDMISSQRMTAISKVNGKHAIYKEIDGFLTTTNLDRQLAIAQKLSSMGMSKAVGIAGDMYAELATKMESPDEKLVLLDAASKQYDRVIHQESMRHSSRSALSASAQFSKVFLPHLQWEAICGSLPPASQKAEVHSNAVSLSKDVSERYSQIRRAPELRDEAIDLHGLMGEMACLLLLNRFDLRELGGSSWSARPSTFSEDKGGRKGSYYVRRWDVNVMNQFVPDPPETIYRIQVKVGEDHLLGRREYVDDVIPTSIDRVVRAPGQKHNVPPTMIIENCHSEAIGIVDPVLQGTLDSWQNRLLDHLENA